MRFVIALVVSFALVWLCAKPLKKYPAPFYLGAVALLGLYFWGRPPACATRHGRTSSRSCSGALWRFCYSPS